METPQHFVGGSIGWMIADSTYIDNRPYYD